MNPYARPGITPGNIRRFSRWLDVGDRTTRYLVTDNAPDGSVYVPVRVIADGSHPAAGVVFYLRRDEFWDPVSAGGLMIRGQLQLDLDRTCAYPKGEQIGQIREDVVEPDMTPEEAEATIADALGMSAPVEAEALKPRPCICTKPLLFAAELGSGTCGLCGREPRG